MPITMTRRMKSAISCAPRLFSERVASTPDEAHRLHYRLPSRDCGDERKNGGDWFGSGPDCSLQRRQSSKGSARKAASAHIAKIPFALAYHIAQAWMPQDAQQEIA